METAALHNEEGVRLFQSGRTTEAVAEFEKSLHIMQSFGQETAELAAIYNNVGMILRDEGKFDAALEYYKQSQRILQNVAPRSTEVATTFNNIGAIYDAQGKLDEALRQYKRCLLIEEQLAPETLDIATTHNNIGVIYNAQKKLDEAIQEMSKGLAIQERLAPHSLDIASTCLNVGTVFKQQGKLDEALDHFVRTKEIRKSLVPGSLTLAAAHMSVAKCYESQKRLDQALEEFSHGLAIQEKLQPESMDVAATYSSIGSIYASQNKIDEALSVMLKGLEIQEKASPGGKAGAEIYDTLRRLMESNTEEGTKAQEMFEKARKIRELALKKLAESKLPSIVSAPARAVRSISPSLRQRKVLKLHSVHPVEEIPQMPLSTSPQGALRTESTSLQSPGLPKNSPSSLTPPTQPPSHQNDVFSHGRRSVQLPRAEPVLSVQSVAHDSPAVNKDAVLNVMDACTSRSGTQQSVTPPKLAVFPAFYDQRAALTPNESTIPQQVDDTFGSGRPDVFEATVPPMQDEGIDGPSSPAAHLPSPPSVRQPTEARRRSSVRLSVSRVPASPTKIVLKHLSFEDGSWGLSPLRDELLPLMESCGSPSDAAAVALSSMKSGCPTSIVTATNQSWEETKSFADTSSTSLEKEIDELRWAAAAKGFTGSTQYLSLKDLARVFAQIAMGLGELHSRRIVHRDLRPENMRVTNRNVWKIVLTSSMRRAGVAGEDEESMLVAGSSMQTGRWAGVYECSHDVWSLGCVILYVIDTICQMHLADQLWLQMLEYVADVSKKLTASKKHSLGGRRRSSVNSDQHSPAALMKPHDEELQGLIEKWMQAVPNTALRELMAPQQPLAQVLMGCLRLDPAERLTMADINQMLLLESTLS